MFVFSDTRRLEVCGYGGRSIATLRVLPCHNGWHYWHPDGCPTHLWICGSRQDHRHLQRKIILIDTYILILWCSECSSVKRLCQWMLLLYCYSNPTSRYHSVRIYPMSVQTWLENMSAAFFLLQFYTLLLWMVLSYLQKELLLNYSKIRLTMWSEFCLQKLLTSTRVFYVDTVKIFCPSPK